MIDFYIELMTKAILKNDAAAKQQADELSYDFSPEDMEYCHKKLSEIKPNTSTDDERVLSELQGKLDRLNEQRRDIARRLLPVKKRLQAKMEKEKLKTLQCVNYVMKVKETHSDSDEDDDSSKDSIVYTEKRLAAFLGEDQLKAYKEANARPRKRKRTQYICERDIIDLVETDSEKEQ